MFFRKIFSGSLTEPRYIRRTRAYLEEARMAMLEHSIAAEHYQSSAEMYAERARRLEEELQHWEAQRDAARSRRSGEEGATAAKFAGPAKLESAPVVVSPSQPASVGIVRAA